ncbi:rod shape-determining protein RodA [Candidatus Falkowbacteria bacterium]|nr:rod shape-determining protein RodA [Candidatus Falkowbacteria bacterium]
MKLSLRTLTLRFDWILFFATFVIVALSIIVLYSIALATQDATDLLNFKKQLFFAFVGFAMYALFAFKIDYASLLSAHKILYVIGAFLLTLVLVAGQTVRGTTGWFVIGGFSFQPVELVKIFMLFSLSAYCSVHAHQLKLPRYLFGSVVGVMGYIALILLQPDFGSAFLIASTWFGLVFFAGMRKLHAIGLVVCGVLAVALLWFFGFADYQKDRIKVFLNPSLDPLGAGYNVTQSMIAVGSGQWFGTGLSFGSQSKLKFLPEAQTDFIFAVIAEQLGFVGVIVLLTLFGVIIARLLVHAPTIHESGGGLLLLGISLTLSIQIFVNIGMNMGILPVTGVTLPLVSYGGSSLVTTLLLLGIGQGVIMRGHREILD